MSPNDFVLWLRGFLAATGNQPNAQQIDAVVCELEQVGRSTVPGPTLAHPSGVRTACWPTKFGQQDPFQPTL